MDALIGMTGSNFTLIASSLAATRGASILKSNDDKTRALTSTTLLAYTGEPGDTVQFAEYIQANIRLYSMRASSLGTGLRANNTSKVPEQSTGSSEPTVTPADSTTVQSSDSAAAKKQNEGASQAPGGPSGRGDELPPAAVAAFVRNEIATALRSRNAYSVNTLLGGVDLRTGKPSLYWLDYLAACAAVPYAAHGYAQYYCLSIMDKHHRPSITFEQGLKILRMCTDELKRRLPIDFKGMLVKVITVEGIRTIEWDNKGYVVSA